jgi:hypothetical protein
MSNPKPPWFTHTVNALNQIVRDPEHFMVIRMIPTPDGDWEIGLGGSIPRAAAIEALKGLIGQMEIEEAVHNELFPASEDNQ